MKKNIKNEQLDLSAISLLHIPGNIGIMSSSVKNATADNYDYILIEGTMGALSGLLDPSVEYPLSTIKTAMEINALVLLINDLYSPISHFCFNIWFACRIRV
jgi:dethiobiotin synthetase